jgi:hypothetical protein
VDEQFATAGVFGNVRVEGGVTGVEKGDLFVRTPHHGGGNRVMCGKELNRYALCRKSLRIENGKTKILPIKFEELTDLDKFFDSFSRGHYRKGLRSFYTAEYGEQAGKSRRMIGMKMRYDQDVYIRGRHPGSEKTPVRVSTRFEEEKHLSRFKDKGRVSV